jgi:plasmid stabilization system protein ParE
MRLVWLPEAQTDVRRLYDFLLAEAPSAAERAIRAIPLGAGKVLDFPRIGRPMEDETERRELLHSVWHRRLRSALPDPRRRDRHRPRLAQPSRALVAGGGDPQGRPGRRGDHGHRPALPRPGDRPPLTGHPHCSTGIAARRNRVRELILPEAHEPDFDDLPDSLRAGLTLHFAGDDPQGAQIACADAAGSRAPWPPAGPRVWIRARHRRGSVSH